MDHETSYVLIISACGLVPRLDLSLGLGLGLSLEDLWPPRPFLWSVGTVGYLDSLEPGLPPSSFPPFLPLVRHFIHVTLSRVLPYHYWNTS